MFENEPFKCFLVLSIDLGVDSLFYDVAKSRQNGKGPLDFCLLPFMCKGTNLE